MRLIVPLRAGLIGLAVLALAAAVPRPASAHPLGNFTINHYAGLRVALDRIDLDVVIDRAEIPTFQERQRIDADGDGQVSDGELEAERQVACGRLVGELSLTAGDAPLALIVEAAGLSFPSGAAGLQTMRLACEYEARPFAIPAAGTSVVFTDGSDAGRIGWREIVVTGDGVTLSGSVRTSGVSNRLNSYPSDLLNLPLDDRAVTFSATPGGQSLPALCVAEANALSPGGLSDAGFGCASAPAATSPGETAPAAVRAGGQPGAVPGGVGGEISSLLETRDLTPIALAFSLLAAAALGGFHALTPGHGKTVLAAYLVGTRGTARHALALGLSVTVSHTIGVALLAGLIVAAGNALPADRYQHIVAVLSGLIIVAIGGLLLAGRIRAWRRARSVARAVAHDQDHHFEDEHPHGDDSLDHHHEHGGRSHSHLPPPGRELSWRTLFALGLSGGIVPSTSALIILLATVTTGRPAYGLILVVAFGLGMALVLSAVGLVLVYSRAYVERLPGRHRLQRLGATIPLLTAALVLGIGVLLTGSALLGRSLTG